MENEKVTQMKLVKEEQLNPYYNPDLASNGGGYDQPYFKYVGIIAGQKAEVNITDTSCGDFGERWDIDVQSNGKRMFCSINRMDNEPNEYCMGTHNFTKEFRNEFKDWLVKTAPWYGKTIALMMDEQERKDLQEDKKQNMKDAEIENSKILIIDTETTGFKPDDEILQVSIVDANGEKVYNQYFKPEHKQSWESAEQVNHISPTSTKDKPYLKMHKETIEKLLDSASLIVGYNTGFDMKMLEQNGIKIPQDTKYVDLMIPFAKVYGEKNEYGKPKWQKLVTCAKTYGYNTEKADWHNSLGDTMATRFCFNEMRTRCHITKDDVHNPMHLVGYNPKEFKRVKGIPEGIKRKPRPIDRGRN